MGILNVTPDSFSDGGRFLDADRALEQAKKMIREGASMVDIGPESTRPGSFPVPPEVQIARAIPVIKAIRSHDPNVLLSIDTTSAEVAQAAMKAGADIVNDTSALSDDPAMANTIAECHSFVILMHRRGTPREMQHGGGPHYDDVIAEVVDFLGRRVEGALRAGIDPDKILLDPGIGFGKRVEHNLLILRRLDRFFALGRPLVLGASRKSFIGSVANANRPTDREAGSLTCAVLAAVSARAAQASLILRVHDVAGTLQAVETTLAIIDAT